MRCLVLCEPAQSKCTWTCQQSHLMREFTRQCRAPGPRHPFCASLRSRNAQGHVTRAILCRNLKGKCRKLIPRHPFCASLRSRNAHGPFHKNHFVWKFTGKMPDATDTMSINQRVQTPTVRAVWPHCLGKHVFSWLVHSTIDSQTLKYLFVYNQGQPGSLVKSTQLNHLCCLGFPMVKALVSIVLVDPEI